MNKEDLTLLETPEIRTAIEANIDRDPNAVALDKRLPHPALVATQIKYLQRARKKLPEYHAARAIIPPLAFEQSSSHLTAGHKRWRGGTCIDLTCGLGVDSLHLSYSFDRVITVERDETLAEIAVINFRRLGADNIEVVNDSAENFLERSALEGGHADLVYVDPDRRSASGRKLVRPEDCSPDITALMPLMLKCADRVAAKLSPLFDVDEAFRLFGERCSVEVVSAAGECKEILIELGAGATSPTVTASAIGAGSVRYPFSATRPAENGTFAPPYRYMIIPDVALRKARLTCAYASQYLPGSYPIPNGGYIFYDGEKLPDKIIGKVFEVLSMERYDPARLKKELKRRGIRSVRIYTNDFPASAAAIAAKLGVREGDDTCMAFTRINGTPWRVEIAETVTAAADID